MLNLPLSSVQQRKLKRASSIHPAVKVHILIRNDSLTPEELKAKRKRNVFKYVTCGIRFEHFSWLRS